MDYAFFQHSGRKKSKKQQTTFHDLLLSVLTVRLLTLCQNRLSLFYDSPYFLRTFFYGYLYLFDGKTIPVHIHDDFCLCLRYCIFPYTLTQVAHNVDIPPYAALYGNIVLIPDNFLPLFLCVRIVQPIAEGI